MAIEKLKVNCKTINQDQSTNKKKKFELTDQTTDTTQKYRTHIFKILIPFTLFVREIVNLCGFK